MTPPVLSAVFFYVDVVLVMVFVIVGPLFCCGSSPCPILTLSRLCPGAVLVTWVVVCSAPLNHVCQYPVVTVLVLVAIMVLVTV